MKVCTCCYHPEVQDDSPFVSMFMGLIEVPDDTLTEKSAVLWGSKTISPKILENAGLRWDRNLWCTPQGEYIKGVYSVINKDGLEDWMSNVLGNQQIIIPYLKSRPVDDSTLGYGDHMKRQAQICLKLFDEHVLGSYSEDVDIQYSYNGEFAGSYGTTKEIDLENPAGLDTEGIQRIAESVKADQKKIAKLGIEFSGDDERAKQYCYKLRRSLAENLRMLDQATRFTQTSYDIQDKAPKSVQGIGLFLVTFASRHQTDSTSSAVSIIYRVMLPILVAKLAEKGYPDSELVTEWDYVAEPSKAHGLKSMGMAADALGMELKAGTVSKITATCQNCGHKIELEVFEDMINQGDVSVTGIPEKCPKCGQ